MQFHDGYMGHNQSDNVNSRGHRCKEIEDLNLHNYILFVGDHASVDFEVPLEETYPHLVSKGLSCDYYNLSVTNGGIDAIKANTIAWHSKVKYPPKAIIIGYKFLNILLASDKNYSFFDPVDYRREIVSDLVNYADEFNYFKTKCILLDNLLPTITNCPIYQVIFDNNFPPFKSNISIIDGIDATHDVIAKRILQVLTSKKKQMKP